MPSNWRGVTSSKIALAKGRSDSCSTHVPVTTLPPRSVSSLVIAAISWPLPPSITGQPVVCASTSIVSPNALVSGADSGMIAWAVMPASSARPSGVCSRRANTVAGGMLSTPNCTTGIGWAAQRTAAAPAPVP